MFMVVKSCEKSSEPSMTSRFCSIGAETVRVMLPITKWLWKDEFWFPPGFSWEDMKETEEIRYPQPCHLLLSIPFTALLLILRVVFQRTIALSLGRKMGLKEKVRKEVSPNAVLEAYYRTHQKQPKERELKGLAKQCDLQPRKVERWFRSRLKQDQLSLTEKFCEASWMAIFSVITFIMGLAVFYDKSLFWDDREWWTGYPRQPLLPSTFAYYMLQLSIYCSISITLFFQRKKKFDEQLLHHAVTIFLICYSYCANYLRIGTLVIFIFECSTFFMALTKVFIYVKWQRTSKTLFILFAIMFFSCRIVIFPYKVLYNTYYCTMEFVKPFFGYYLINASLMVLQLLSIFWTFLIFKMMYKLLKFGTMKKDIRSDSEDSKSDKEETEQKEASTESCM
ncbi:ceramide synthase 4-like [Eublepharis macularius]|uniref:Ceramide synthase 4-like n=1 Tax=Eublepharis macularius TaxID=481883 RepID=A0AA97L117_EUBMA|nr:ceramide synthase 4-like [Eublepharis macularius]